MRGLKKVMIEKDIWCAELSRRTGLLPNTINNYVNAKSYPTVINAIKIAKGLGVTLNYIWGEERKSDPKSIISDILEKYCKCTDSAEFLNYLKEKKAQY